MKKSLVCFVLLILCISNYSFSQQRYDGVWSDETRHSPTNPSFFVSFTKLEDGRYFILVNRSSSSSTQVWESSIGSITNGVLFSSFNDGEWKFIFGIDKKKIDYITMISVDNSDMVIGLGRVSEQPIKKLEGTVRKEVFTK